MAFLVSDNYGIEFYNILLHDLLDRMEIYHQLDENQCQILNALGELQDCKYGRKLYRWSG